MRIDDYDPMNPLDSAVGDRIRTLARDRPLAAERLLRALEEFVGRDTGIASKVLEHEDNEIYLVPPRFVLAHVPDIAAPVRVNHASRLIDIVEIIEEYGGYDEPDQWKELEELALRNV